MHAVNLILYISLEFQQHSGGIQASRPYTTNEPSRKRAIDCVVKWPMQQQNDVHSFRTLNCNINTTNARATPYKYRHAFEIKCRRKKINNNINSQAWYERAPTKTTTYISSANVSFGKRKKKKNGQKMQNEVTCAAACSVRRSWYIGDSH